MSTETCNSVTDTSVTEGIAVVSPRRSWMRTNLTALTGSATRKGMTALVDQSIVSATNFFTGVIIGRACTKEQFGLYMLGFSIVYLLVIDLQHSLITSPYTVYSPRLNGKVKAQYTGSILIHQVILSTLTVACLSVAGLALSLGIGPPGLASVVWTLVLVITFILLKDYARRVSFAQLRMVVALVVDSSVAVIQIGGLLLLAYLDMLSAARAYWMVGGACGLVGLGWLTSIRKRFIMHNTQVISDFRRNWSIGKWMCATTLADMASTQLYPWLLAGFHGVAATGIFSACQGVIFIASPFILGFSNFLAPKTAHTYAEGGVRPVRHLVAKATFLIATIMSLFCLTMLFLGGKFVVLVYGPKYGGYGLEVTLLAFGFLAWSLSVPMGCALLAMERPDVLFKSYLVATATTVVIGIPLVYLYGLAGAVVALGTSTLAAVIFRTWFFCRLTKVNLEVKSHANL